MHKHVEQNIEEFANMIYQIIPGNFEQIFMTGMHQK